jgi:hypothetical protein
MKPRSADRIFLLQQNTIAMRIHELSQNAPVARIRADFK